MTRVFEGKLFLKKGKKFPRWIRQHSPHQRENPREPYHENMDCTRGSEGSSSILTWSLHLGLRSRWHRSGRWQRLILRNRRNLLMILMMISGRNRLRVPMSVIFSHWHRWNRRWTVVTRWRCNHRRAQRSFGYSYIRNTSPDFIRTGRLMDVDGSTASATAGFTASTTRSSDCSRLTVVA